MRISTRAVFLQGVRQMQNIQSQVSRTQEQISTGRRMLRPSDDPIAAARAVGFRESLARLEQFQRNGDAARSRLEYEESALDAVTNVLQRVRELALHANNATETGETRQIMAVELRGRVADLVQLANQKDGNGRYLFSGSLDDIPPVSQTTGGFVYNGDQSQRLIQVGETRQVFDGDPGADLFFHIRNGNGAFRVSPDAGNTGSGVVELGSVVDPTVYDKAPYTVRFIDPTNYEVLDGASTVIATGTYVAGESISFQGIAFTLDGAPAAGDQFQVNASSYQSVFDTVQNITLALDTAVTDSQSQAVLNNALNLGIQEIDQALGNVSNVRTQIGIRLNTIEAQNDSNGAASLLASEAIAGLEDLDYAEALSLLSQQASTLEAAQQSFVITQRLSLFQFL